MQGGPADLANFHPENELEAAMAHAAGDLTRFPDFLAALRDADLFVPGRDPVAEDTDAGHETVILPVVRWQGRDAVPVFSSLSRLREAVEDIPSYMAFHFRDLAGLWQEQWMLLNPGSALGLPLSPAQIRGDPGTTEAEPAGGGQLVIGEPAVEDHELLHAITEACRDSGQVVAAHRALVTRGRPGERPRLVIGVEVVAGGDRDRVLARISRATAGGRLADVIHVDPADAGPIGAFMLSAAQPFFRRGPGAGGPAGSARRHDPTGAGHGDALIFETGDDPVDADAVR